MLYDKHIKNHIYGLFTYAYTHMKFLFPAHYIFYSV